MIFPNFEEEKELWAQGYQCVIGLDEVGRGPLAGPVVAAACAINPKYEYRNSKQIQNSNVENSKHVSDFDIRFSNLGVNDSKKLSEKRRQEIYGEITSHPAIAWGIGIVSEEVIDKINILEATKLAMQEAIKNLEKKYSIKSEASDFMLCPWQVDYLLIDGNFILNLNEASYAKGSGVPKQKSIIKGDQKVFSISAASIIAKVTRDRIMLKMHQEYPNYGFDGHKGYGTATHIKAIKTFGPCKIHRKSFEPIKSIAKN